MVEVVAAVPVTVVRCGQNCASLVIFLQLSHFSIHFPYLRRYRNFLFIIFRSSLLSFFLSLYYLLQSPPLPLILFLFFFHTPPSSFLSVFYYFILFSSFIIIFVVVFVVARKLCFHWHGFWPALQFFSLRQSKCGTIFRICCYFCQTYSKITTVLANKAWELGT